MANRTREVEALFTGLYAEHFDLVQRTVAAGLRREHLDLVEDLAQETFLEFWRYLTSGATITNPVGLLVTMARHAVVHHYRRRSSGELAADFSDFLQERRLPSSAAAEDTALDRLEAYATVLALPSRTRVAVAA